MKYSEIKPYIEKGLVNMQRHPENCDICIFNYTPECQFGKKWDKVTRACRGLILNILTDEVIARPFEKFFNYEELLEQGVDISTTRPFITKKYDGSLGILYWLNGKPWIATRGSFTSDQAIWATNWIRKNVGENRNNYFFDIEETDAKWTHLFEIIYPENRIVITYDFSGLVYLGSIFKEDGSQRFLMPPEPIKALEMLPFHDFHDWKGMQAENTTNEEGFVVYDKEKGLRFKIKFEEYKRLHRIVTGVSEIAIWESLRDGKSLNEFLDKVPDEFAKWVNDIVNHLRANFAEVWGRAMIGAQMAGAGTRKEKAVYIMKNYPEVSAIIFAIIDEQNRRAVERCWKMVRPRGQSIFKADIDS